MKKIIIAYWKGKFKELDYIHNSELDYSLISKGFSVMLKPVSDGILIIYIDKGRFGQS